MMTGLNEIPFYKKLTHMFSTLFSPRDINVQLSKKAMELFQNKQFASKVIDRIIIDHKKLDNGENIVVQDENSSKSISIVDVVTVDLNND
jgi:hypothetical protein